MENGITKKKARPQEVELSLLFKKCEQRLLLFTTRSLLLTGFFPAGFSFAHFFLSFFLGFLLSGLFPSFFLTGFFLSLLLAGLLFSFFLGYLLFSRFLLSLTTGHLFLGYLLFGFSLSGLFLGRLLLSATFFLCHYASSKNDEWLLM